LKIYSSYRIRILLFRYLIANTSSSNFIFYLV